MQAIDTLSHSDLTVDDLRQLTNEMVDRMLGLIEDCVDADVTLEVPDPQAHDPEASVEDEVTLPWTLGHVIVHATASAEEAAFLAAELARGVPLHGRSRSEVPWRTVTTVEQCRHRLEESRRMRLETLEVWPDEPHLDNTYIPREDRPPLNCVSRFLNGLRHDKSHIRQIERLVRESAEYRAPSTE
ncbi:MAG TPA: DinB family protein [Chloroflexia bacterium]|nr:DinB family protein [Chloroflexia bacterium]